MTELKYIPLEKFYGPLSYLGKEVYECMKCKYQWRGDAGMQAPCRCGSNYIKWLTWETDWTYDLETNEWKRK